MVPLALPLSNTGGWSIILAALMGSVALLFSVGCMLGACGKCNQLLKKAERNEV